MTLMVEHLSFQYGKRPILTDITFQANPGEIVAVLGPNGSGKSTLFRSLVGILSPTKGRVVLNNRNILEQSVEMRAKKIAYVPQRIEASPIPVIDAILLGRKPYFRWFASSYDYRVVEQVMAELDILPMAHRPLDTLSGGEMQKVALARAFVQEPELLILDEPISALDLKNQIAIITLLLKIVRDRKIIALISLHDINIAIRYANRFLLLREGKISGDVRYEGLTPAMLENVYDLPVEIHTSQHGISFVIESSLTHETTTDK